MLSLAELPEIHAAWHIKALLLEMQGDIDDLLLEQESAGPLARMNGKLFAVNSGLRVRTTWKLRYIIRVSGICNIDHHRNLRRVCRRGWIEDNFFGPGVVLTRRWYYHLHIARENLAWNAVEGHFGRAR